MCTMRYYGSVTTCNVRPIPKFAQDFLHYKLYFDLQESNEPCFTQFLSQVFCGLFLTKMLPNLPVS